MNPMQPYFLTAIAGIMLTGFSTWGWLAANGTGLTDHSLLTSSPSSSVTTNYSDSNASQIAQSDSSVIPEDKSISTTQPPNPVTKTITLNIYRTDSQCQTLTPEPVAIAAEMPVTASVGNIINQASSSDLDLAGYRINLKNGIATIDLRLSPNSQRQFISLSMCEQLALFGSIRKTLLENPQLKIKEVRFTDQGQKIII